MLKMTEEQRRVYDKIMKRVNEKKSSLFFLYDFGEIGKSFIWRVMSAALRSKDDIVLPSLLVKLLDCVEGCVRLVWNST